MLAHRSHAHMLISYSHDGFLEKILAQSWPEKLRYLTWFFIHGPQLQQSLKKRRRCRIHVAK